MLSLLLGFCIIILSLSISESMKYQYCATIDANDASGASGFVALQIENGQAIYDFNLNMKNFESSVSCDLDTAGLNWHIHSYWTNEAASAATSNCSSCKGHYDPNFACSASSQAISTYCPAINRTSTSSPAYTYNCTSNYELGRYSFCELGDISGKSGTVYPNNQLDFSLKTPFYDNQPIYAENYFVSDATSLQWASVVFHCGVGNARLVCAKFSTKDLSACQSTLDSFSTSSNSNPPANDDNVSKKKFDGAVASSVIICSFGAFLIGFLVRKYFFSPVVKSFDTRGMAAKEEDKL